jgi:DNA-binding XRE family transcriptional regulator
MSASAGTDKTAIPATAARFNSELFDERCAALEATTEVARAALVGVDPATLYRYRKGQFAPRQEIALRIAELLDVSIEQLWVRA